MDSVATAVQPIPRWQSIVYGWYLPAWLALVWFSSAVWQDITFIQAIDHQTISIFIQRLHSIFFASVFLNGSILFALNPQKHIWLGIIWFIGIALIVRYYASRYESAGFALSIRAFELPNEAYYVCNVGTLLLSAGLSLSIMLIQYLVNAQAYTNWRSRILAWLALTIVAACYLSLEFEANAILKPVAAAFNALNWQA
ncbi:hypothetical protein ACP8Y2_02170 [Herpetosiphon llansteffanensis]